MDKLSFQRTGSSEQNAELCGDIMPFDEQLRTTLHCDDKEKLRRKLELLQREYLKTAERLQRAEHFDAVRKHVRRRISQQNQRDQDVTSNPRVSPSPLILHATNGAATSEAQCEGLTGVFPGPVDSDISRKSQVIRFLLPSEDPCTETLIPSHGAARGHRSSPTLRLRSRRSRLRWERRSAEAGRSTDDNSEEGQEHSERMEIGGEGRDQSEGTQVVNESEEFISGTDSESPSLLLTHWNTCGQNETGDIEGSQIQGQQEQRENETELRSEGEKKSKSTSLVLRYWDPADRELKGTQNGNRKEGEEDVENCTEQRLCGNSSDKDNEQNSAEETEKEKRPENPAELKKDKSEMVGFGNDVKAVSLLDSCTLVEGLIFPAEYYVRTTRRMSSSQSQPNMQAIILSQLSPGRRCSRRGRGRRSNRHTQNSERSDQHTNISLSPPTTASVAPYLDSQPAEQNTQSSSELSDRFSGCQIDMGVCFSPIVPTARPARGRRKKRGRGRGRPQTPRCSLSLDSNQVVLSQKTSEDPPPKSSPVNTSPPLHGAAGPKPFISTVPDVPQPACTNSTDTPPPPGVIAAQSASGPLGKVFPIFHKSGEKSNRSTPISRDAASWQSLLLPSSPLAQTSLLPLPSLSNGSLFNNLMNFDIIQDFHLPDEQFALLKLHKLRQVSVASGVEPLSTPSYITRRSSRRFVGSDAERLLPLPLSLTPTITNSPLTTEAASHSDLQNVSMKYSRSVTEDPGRVIKETLGEQQTGNLQIESQTKSPRTGSVPVVQDVGVDQYQERMILNADHTVEPQPHINLADIPAGRANNYDHELPIKESLILSEEQTVSHAVIHPLEEHVSTNNQTDTIRTLSFDSSLQETPEEPPESRCADQLCNISKASPLQILHEKSPALDSREPPARPARRTPGDRPQPHSSQLLLSPALASAPFITQHPPPASALLSSPTLPSLGLTPHLLPSCPSAPPLTLPPPHSPSTQALSPPALSQCRSQIRASSEPPRTDGQSQRIEAPPCRTVPGILSQGGKGETAEEHMMRCTHTLKAPAGGCLVDACLLRGSSGGLCVAAAGKWALCLWSQSQASDWSLTHTWAFNEPVIDVFPVPDAAGLMCVTLGQLEIREIRMLSCRSLSQLLLCDSVVQAVVCVSGSRVVTSSHSASGSSLQVFTLSDSGSSFSTPAPQLLVSPGVCVGALAAVDGLSDALVGSDESGHLFVWNLQTGQLLQRIILEEDLSHMACLRGYSYCGVLFVLLQHQLLSSLEEEVKEREDESRNMALFSLVAINPLSGKSALATRLYPPKAWSGRLCEADVSSSSVVGLSQSGCVCVWELGPRGAPRMVSAPESEGWQLARWGGEGTLVTGHHNGDVTLHYSQTSL
ncbi:partner and localizer of BRCA2 isoform X1 [Eleginops maclovinus]|uniref:partner and localizer of BRCA2 isoform X1 n=1 Tax=Eleginops maclovinus TaxID=56733 RepID=UPI00307FE1F4